VKRVFIVALKFVGLWMPATIFWSSLVFGVPILDFRTDGEVEEDDMEARRLERFFDVEGLPDNEYMVEWSSKEEALSQIVEKVLRSQRFATALTRWMAEDEADGGIITSTPRPDAWTSERSLGSDSSTVVSVEVSYVLPPPVDGAWDDSDKEQDSLGRTQAGGGARPWWPRLIVAHSGGAMALLSLSFEHVEHSKDREERWACTALRCQLMASRGGFPAQELVFNMRGPVPHGVRYQRF
jgi:hypothetical protein